ncbi:hypothetical protein [Mesorhizobium sp. YR577]|uniref:hypothetical protein n=1 Tax=Mesorhizobium sp. YR577 TaxID=1884373 RepID=UPI0008EDA3C8|nr:hypothetical protein [Mesorhizobium sp. YR577]SFT39088.1 hypothetical protein SAMN05518861_10131 [Mesorhizobium sp. YR577]
MANPQRIPDPRETDPMNPIPPLASSAEADPRLNAANSSRPIENTVVQSRSGGSGILIAAIVLVLAVIAYFIFVPTTPNSPVEQATPPAATETAPATPVPATPAPDATAPAAPATPATPAPDATAPAAPAPAEPAPAPATPAPAPAAPAQ